ncbi:MAG TPA: hypothetical protein VG934_02765 [Candidatus Paceibacterota bacterium]|nr:hypothetical protein [Candidatus Paceibacterota bacterium]
MQKITLIAASLAAIVMILLGALVVIGLLRGNAAPAANQDGNTPVSILPGDTGGPTGQVEVPAQGSTSGTSSGTNGQASDWAPKDVIANTETGAYPASGYYYLGYHVGQASSTDPMSLPNPPFLILYIDQTQYFNISLLQEPIADTRVAVEQYLMSQYGISQDQMCALNYTMSVPYSVDQTYSGIDLRFSFCPGATTL